MGIIPTTSPRPTARNIRNKPATKVEILVRAPDARTLIIVWPIMAQPPIPPNSAARMLEVPCPIDSRVFDEVVSVMLSTSWAVINDSNSPTTAMANAAGRMMRKVSMVKGTSGSVKMGNSLGSSPLSATVGTLILKKITTNVTTTIATSGAGIAAVTLGHKNIITRLSANRGYTAQGTSMRSGN